MRDDLLAYLLDDVDPDQRRRIEQRLDSDPIWQRELERLRACLEAQSTGPPSVGCPPNDLVEKTCSLVDSAVLEARKSCPNRLSEASEFGSHTRRWSIADWTVGGGIVAVVVMLLFPALHESRDSARRMKCQDNLRELGAGLVDYAERGRQGLPHVGYHQNAGIFVVELAEGSRLSRKQLAELLVCPGSQLADDVFSGKIVMHIPTRDELNAATEQQLLELQKHMSGSFAYQFGYVDAKGNYCHMKFVGRSDAPMLADAPSYSVEGFQSANHGGCGQNVIFQDLSSRYCSQCVYENGDKHLFLNTAGQHAAGRTPLDYVLGRSEATPAGNLQSARQ